MDREPPPDVLARQAAAEPSEPLYTMRTAEGTVKRWRDEKGTGVIACAATAPWDIWCHFSALEMPGYKSLAPGERVEVEYVRANRESFRYVAERVRRLDPSTPAGGHPPGAG
jgi:CspA family cold shock protein